MMKIKVEAAQRLRDKVAIVTGGGGTCSIGRSIAIRFAEEGARVAVLDIDGPSAMSVATEIQEGGRTASAFTCDVTDLRQCEDTAKRVAQAWGDRIDMLVNNAAALRGKMSNQGWKPFDEWSQEDWDYMMAVNLRGQWFCARAVVPYMKAAGYGKIINLTSSTFWEAVPGFIHYVSSKGGVIGFTRALGRELGGFGIRVNALAPGFTLTEANKQHDGMDHDFRESYRLSQSLSQRSELPEDLAGPAFFLASEDSDFMTCQTLLVDGGKNVW